MEVDHPERCDLLITGRDSKTLVKQRFEFIQVNPSHVDIMVKIVEQNKRRKSYGTGNH